MVRQETSKSKDPSHSPKAAARDILPLMVIDLHHLNFRLFDTFPVKDDRLFTLHELASTLSVQAIPKAPNGTSSIIASASIKPTDPPAGAVFAAAEILIPKPSAKFPTPYIYVSNRNTGIQDSRGDSIAIFQHVNKGRSNEGLRLITQVYTGLDQIRGMEFGPAATGGDEFLVAGGVAGSAGVIVLRRIDGGRNLQVVARNLDIPTRTSFVWL